MWSKFFANKIEDSLDNLIRQELSKTVDMKTDLTAALEEAKSDALRRVVIDKVHDSLLKQFNTEVYEQTEKAIQVFNSALQKALENSKDTYETRDIVFNKVHKMYPSANVDRSSHVGYRFCMPSLTVQDIIYGLTDKIIAEIAETD